LNRFLESDAAALPYLKAALTRFLEEYPWTVDGLSRTERRLLELAGDGIGRKKFGSMHVGERCYYITDMSVTALADELSHAAPPLLDFVSGTATLTHTGRAVLEGRLDRIAVCGIDRWLGGVHLRSGEVIWRWDPAHQCVVRG
jgi:hypothetical protein